MKKLFYIILTFLLVECAQNKTVYWCGDHPCINNKEKEDYFKKTMIVEKRTLNSEDPKKNSEIEKIIKQAHEKQKLKKVKEKKLAKQAKLNEKKRIKEEKKLEKQAKLNEKKRIKEEKKLEKQIEKDLKKSTKEKKKETSNELKVKTNFAKIDSEKFDNLVDKIIRKNSLKSYPNLNDIPN